MQLDIVGLQEVDQFVNRSGKQDTMKILSESSGLEYYAFFKAINHDGGEYGLGILSRYPIVSSKTTKLYSGSEEQRVLGQAVIDVCGKHINFFVTHMSYESQTLWDKQFEEIAPILEESIDYILTGDFNVTNFIPFYNDLDGAEIVNYGSGALPTFEDGTTIDNIIYSESFWSFEEPQTLPNGHSDHYLLFSTAEWK
jgi:endonuclease/exonuclease/phosphatase family metal-dependent hydrolase